MSKKNLTMTSCRQIVTSLSFFRFMANLEQYASRVRDVKLKIFINSNFYLKKTENKTKKTLTQLSHYCFELRYYFCQKMIIILQKNADISKVKKASGTKVIFSETTYVCILTYPISSF